MTPEKKIQDRIEAIQANISKVFYGKPEAVKTVLVSLIAGGHALIEDVPGVGKTLLARALAKSMDCRFQRIQFTPDLLPSDILGVSIFDSRRDEFVFRPGPVFANVILADEINRTTPRTQSSLLEAMNELQVSVDGRTHPLPAPFLVLATENPYEEEGTYPLPDSELDRFLIRITIGYPEREYEKLILEDNISMRRVDELSPVVTQEEVLEIQRRAEEVRIADSLMNYILNIVEQTRTDERVRIGVSPRGALFLCRGVRALALIEGMDYCLPDHVKRLADPVLCHRIVCRGVAGVERGLIAGDVVRDVLETLPVPV